MSSAFKSTIYENSRIHDIQAHAYSHVYGRWETKQRMTLIPKLRSDRKLFWPPFCSCLCFRCLVRCILVGSTDPFLVPGSRESPALGCAKVGQRYLYPVDSAISFPNTYPVDSAIQRLIEQPGLAKKKVDKNICSLTH